LLLLPRYLTLQVFQRLAAVAPGTITLGKYDEAFYVSMITLMVTGECDLAPNVSEQLTSIPVLMQRHKAGSYACVIIR
jgi:hypothetical protein